MALPTDAGSARGSNKANDLLSRVTPLQKVAVGAAALTLVGGVVLLGNSTEESVMAAAYTDLEASDAASVTEALVARGVDYELADAGRTVLVPRDELYDVRIDLSSDGLPSSNEGYALLDEQGLTTSEFRQRIDYQRALEGELSRTLRSIDDVNTATVHLALPEDSVFVDEPTLATASVLVDMTGSDMLDRDQVAAMVHLVSSSVKDLDPENVTIADSSGRVLTDGSGDPLLGGGQDVDSDFERAMAGELRTMIGRVTGVDNVAVTVQADLETSERLQTSERFENGDGTEDLGVVVAERTSEETYTGTGAPAGEAGVLGPDGAPVVATGDGESSLTQNDAERTYAVNRTVEQVTFSPGAVNQLSVAVLVDESAVTAEQVATLQELVVTAAGIDPARGDTVTVTALPFETPAEIEALADTASEEAALVAAEQQTELIRTAIIGFVVFVALLLAYRSTRKARREVSTPIDVGSIRANPLTPELATGDDLAPAPIELMVDTQTNEALQELSALADQHPEDVARILQGWLADERQSS